MSESNPPVLAAHIPANPSERLSDPARAVVLEAAGEIGAEWADSSGIVGRLLRTNRGLSSRERRQVSETIYGLVRFDRRLEAILDEILRTRRGPLRVPTVMARGRLKLLLLEATTGVTGPALDADFQRELGFVPAANRINDPDAGLGRRKGIDRDAVRVSFPTWLLEKMAEEHGLTRALALAEALNHRAPISILANVHRIDRDALVARLADEGIKAVPTQLARFGLTLETRVNVAALDSFKEGLFDVMDEGSQLVAEAVDAHPGMRVVDACAGAGGKTLAIDQSMKGMGRILAMDSNGKKLEEARRRLRRAGMTNVETQQVQDQVGPGGLDPSTRPGSWDRVLVDAPCTAVGSMRRAPETRWRLRPEDSMAFANRQLGLLATSAPLVAPGGRLIYATCTLLGEENHRVVERFLTERPGFERLPLSQVLGADRARELGDGLVLRLMPDQHGTDGFFAAVLQKQG